MTQTFGKGPVVDVAVVAAGDEGDAAGGEGGEGCQVGSTLVESVSSTKVTPST